MVEEEADSVDGPKLLGPLGGLPVRGGRIKWGAPLRDTALPGVCTMHACRGGM
jgi:hypothetical protein